MHIRVSGKWASLFFRTKLFWLFYFILNLTHLNRCRKNRYICLEIIWKVRLICAWCEYACFPILKRHYTSLVVLNKLLNLWAFFGVNQSEWPDVMIGFFIDGPTPFLRESLDKVTRLEYPKNKITLYIYNNVPKHSELVDVFFKSTKSDAYLEAAVINSFNYKTIRSKFEYAEFSDGQPYLLVNYIRPKDEFSEQQGRNDAM